MPLDTADEEIRQEVREIAMRFTDREGPMLPILHEVQARFGYIPQAGIPAIADVLNLTRAEVHGVVSFYHDFREAPAGRTVLRICRSEACKSMGADALLAELEAALGVCCGETRADGAVTLEPVYCLGLCACAPAAEVDGALRGRASARALIDEVSR